MKKKIVLLSIFLLTISTLLIVKSKNVIAYTGADKLKNYQQVDTEFRGVWVATVYNLDMKKQKGTNALIWIKNAKLNPYVIVNHFEESTNKLNNILNMEDNK